jgi:hypothetical protein
LRFRHGAHAPYAVRWYGVTALVGHFRNFIATAIASESVDSRDWMRPERPAKLLARVARVLGAAADPASDRDGTGPTTLCAALGRDVWIDFVADTGDDRDVSRAVGAMVAATYTVGDGTAGDGESLPRGDILLFGGDTAYPVASAEEIQNRLVDPWNVSFEPAAGDGVARVLLGIPGNHDWYDGLDGFARLFRRERRRLVKARGRAKPAATSGGGERPSLAPLPLAHVPRKVGLAARQLHLDEVTGLARLVRDAGRSIRAFWRGVGLKRVTRLTLRGYTAVQESSYWALPLSEGLDLWAVDRQLGRLDYGQRTFFGRRRDEAPEARRLFVAPDPAIAFGEEYDPGSRMLAACQLDLAHDPTLYLCGDLHHYERREIGPSLQVIAGGGGAFLHGTRVRADTAPYGAPQVAYPDGAMSGRLIHQVPWKLAFGGAGFLVHIQLAIIASVELSAARWSQERLMESAAVVTAVLAFTLYSIAGHQRAHPRRIAAASIPFAIILGSGPMLLDIALPQAWPVLADDGFVIVAYVLLGAFVIGVFLALACVLGLEHQQAFTVLSHPGYKHFVRLCIRTDGRVDGWVIGKDDPLGKAAARLIDRFSWGGR